MTTGSVAVARLPRILRQTSYPLISGMTTSSRTRSGCSFSTFSSAWAPEDAVTTT